MLNDFMIAIAVGLFFLFALDIVHRVFWSFIERKRR